MYNLSLEVAQRRMECFCRDRTGIREGSEISTKGPEDGSGVLNSILVPLPLQKLGSSFPLTWVGGASSSHSWGLYQQQPPESSWTPPPPPRPAFRAHGIRCRILRARICSHRRARLLWPGGCWEHNVPFLCPQPGVFLPTPGLLWPSIHPAE